MDLIEKICAAAAQLHRNAEAELIAAALRAVEVLQRDPTDNEAVVAGVVLKRAVKYYEQTERCFKRAYSAYESSSSTGSGDTEPADAAQQSASSPLP